MRKVQLIVFTMFIGVDQLFAQPLPPPPPAPGVPIDAVVGLLIVSGVIFGARKLMASRKKSELNTSSI